MTVTENKVKALGLLSGGLDSTLALKLIKEQGIDVTAVHFVLPFSSVKEDFPGRMTEQLGIPLMKVEAGDDYIDIIRKPKYGYGAGMNPCLDCHIYILQRAKIIAEEIGAGFVITGDVLGERPMSQFLKALRAQDRDSGLEGLILRPLSAKLLPETVPEREGWVDRSKLHAIKGRSRKPQMALVEEFGIDGYQQPAGGCLLTQQEFADKVRNLFAFTERVEKRDIHLLRIGRHFYLDSSRIIVGRNERENKSLLDLSNPDDYLLEVPDCGSPITLLEGAKEWKSIEFAARLTARYSDAETREVTVACRTNGRQQDIIVELEPIV